MNEDSKNAIVVYFREKYLKRGRARKEEKEKEMVRKKRKSEKRQKERESSGPKTEEKKQDSGHASNVKPTLSTGYHFNYGRPNNNNVIDLNDRVGRVVAEEFFL